MSSPFVKGDRQIPGADPSQVALRALRVDDFGDETSIATEYNLPYLNLINGDQVIHTFTLTFRSLGGVDQKTTTLVLSPGAVVALPTIILTGVAIDAAAEGAVYFYSDVAIEGNGAGSPVTLAGAASIGPIDVAGATAETVEAGTTVAAGQIVYYQLAMNGKAAADTGNLIYVAIKGATSGLYYAVSHGSTTAGTFMVAATEAVNIVVRNQAAATTYTMSGYFEARVQ